MDPKYFSGLINIEAQNGSNVSVDTINHYTAQGIVKTYDFSHLIPKINDFDDQSNPIFLTQFVLEHPPVLDTFMLILDGMILSPQSALPPGSQDTADYRINEDGVTVEFLFEDGLRQQTSNDTPVLLARYARR